MHVFGPAAMQHIESVLDRIFGGSPEESRRPQTNAAVQSRMRALGLLSLSDYLTFLSEQEEEQGALASLINIGETYFLRTPQHFDALRDVVLPQLRCAGRTHIRMLSAACASGEEPYSLAMIHSETTSEIPLHAEIHAFDMNPEALKRARAGLYSEWSMRAVEEDRRHLFFHTQARQWKLKDSLRKMVHFSTGNLLTVEARQFVTGHSDLEKFDIIFCRNALIYFKPDAIHHAIERLASMLRPGGYLFLGPTETLRGISDAFQLCSSNDTFYYRLSKDTAAPSHRTHFDTPAPMDLLPIPQAPNPTVSTSWFDEIQRSSERVGALTGRKRLIIPRLQQRQALMTEILALIESDHLQEALNMADRLPMTEAKAQPARLIRAALMMQTGRQADAIVLCQEILKREPLNAEAHYLLSLGLEKPNPMAARAHAESAAALDANFAMAQMRIGMLQARAGEPRAARVSLHEAVEALSREDRRRLALYGGGFSRDGLCAVCESEMKRLEALA